MFEVLFSPVLKTFALYVAGMVAYCLFVFSFYRHISKRLLFAYTEPPQYVEARHPNLIRLIWKVGYAVEFILISPLLLFGWSIAITLLLFLFTSGYQLDHLLLLSTALLATLRICAYYSEELSGELAKNFPFAFFIVFLMNSNAVRLSEFYQRVQEVPLYASTFALYFCVIVALELLLRVYDAIVNRE